MFAMDKNDLKPTAYMSDVCVPSTPSSVMSFTPYFADIAAVGILMPVVL